MSTETRRRWIRSVVAAAFGCAAGSIMIGCSSGPFASAKPSATAADIAKYGPSANERITKLRAEREAGVGGDPTVGEQRSAELARQIQNERDPLVRAQIVRTIEMYPTPLSVAVMHAAVGDPDQRVRIAAAEAWGKRGGTEAVEHLDKMLKADENMDVRLNAVKALGATKDRTAVAALGPALEDKDPAMQLLAVQSLENVTGKSLGNDVNKWRAYVADPSKELPPESLADRIYRTFF